MRRFARVELGDDIVPDETTILRFRHLLEEHRLTAAIFETVNGLLTAKRLLLKSGTIVDATIIAAPSSTKNAAQARDPEMKQTRKGNAWHFGMKLHIGTDAKGRVHSVTATHAARRRHHPAARAAARRGARALRGPGVLEGRGSAGLRGPGGALSGESARASPRQPLSARWRAINRARSRTRARGEHPVPRREAAVGIRQGPLSRPREEPGRTGTISQAPMSAPGHRGHAKERTERRVVALATATAPSTSPLD